VTGGAVALPAKYLKSSLLFERKRSSVCLLTTDAGDGGADAPSQTYDTR